MDAIQQEEASEILTAMVQTCALMGTIAEDADVPGDMVNFTGKTFLASLADLASLIGGDEFRNNILHGAMDGIGTMAKFMEIVDGLDD